MSDASPRYACPSCQATFDKPNRFCGRCGASMDLERDDTDLGNEPPGTQGGNGSPARRDRRAQDTGRDHWLGKLIDSRYRVIEVIGRGGMGVVYKVEHQRMGKIAAMKEAELVDMEAEVEIGLAGIQVYLSRGREQMASTVRSESRESGLLAFFSLPHRAEDGAPNVDRGRLDIHSHL